MNESQRQSYLNTMGLESYMPRWLLPGAPPPVVCDLPYPAPLSAHAEPEDSTVPIQPVDQTPVVATGKQASGLSEVLRQVGEPAGKAQARTPEPIPVATSVPEITRFSLSIWRSSLPLLILDERQPRAALPTERLLRNLLQSLGPLEQGRVVEEILPCPTVASSPAHPTVADARAELHSWLEAELAQRPVQKLLLMGENAARYLLSEDADYPALLWRRVTLQEFNRSALLVPSLHDLLQEPGQKRDLWWALHDFRAD